MITYNIKNLGLLALIAAVCFGCSAIDQLRNAGTSDGNNVSNTANSATVTPVSPVANRTVMVVKAKRKPFRKDGAVFTYPIQTARFILTRSMRMADDSPTVTLDVSTQNGISTMEKEFTRTESPTADVKVDFSFKLKLSNQ